MIRIVGDIIYHTVEVFQGLTDESTEFSHTILTSVQDEDFYGGRLDKRSHKASDAEIQSAVEIIVKSRILPKVADDVTVFSDYAALKTLYVKRPSIDEEIEQPPSEDSSAVSASLLLHEAKIMEALRKHPHPNIVAYHGCLVRDGYITGLVLSKHLMTLGDELDRHQTVPEARREHWYQCIVSAVTHLHNLDLALAHNDINPENILLDEDDNAILIDFDCCYPVGTSLRKFGTFGWEGPAAFVSSIANDDFALAQLRAELFPQHYHASDDD